MRTFPWRKADHPDEDDEETVFAAQNRTLRRRRRESPQPAVVDDTFVKVATAAGEPLALMWADMLRQAGMPCSVKGAGAWSSAFPVELQDHFLYVRRVDLARAARLLIPYASTTGPLTLEPAARARVLRRRRWRPQ